MYMHIFIPVVRNTCVLWFLMCLFPTHKDSHVTEGIQESALRNNTWSKDTLHRAYRQMVNQTVTNWDAYRGLRCSEVCLFPFCSDWRPRWLICAVFLPFPSSALMGFKDLGLVLDDQWINKLFSKDKLIASFFLSETAASLPTHMWTVKVLCLIGFSMYI